MTALRTAAALLVCVLLPAAAVSVRADTPAEERPAILREIGWDQKLGQKLPLDARFRDETGKEVVLGDYFGKKPVVLSLVYYGCPMLCTLSLNGLTTALSTLTFDVGKEFEVVTVSFDATETPALAAAKKKAYLQRYGRPAGAAGWHFLTGDRAAVQALTQAAGFRYAWDERTRQFAHPAGVMVLTPEGTIARYLYGIEYAPKDLRLAVLDAGERKIATAADRLVLYCYQYDPTTGRYGLVAMRLLRIAGLLTVAALGGFIYLMRRQELAAAPADGPARS